MWRSSLQNNDIPTPVGHGWCLVDDRFRERLVLYWKSGLPAPTAVMYVQEGLKDDSFDCIQNGLKCSDLCSLITSSKQPDEQEDIQVDLRGTWGGSEHSNTAEKINEHCITARKVNETPSPQHLLCSFTLKVILFHKVNTLQRFFIAHM